jgi:uncharacterized membrane protein
MLFKTIIEYSALLIECCSAAILLLGFIKVFSGFLIAEITQKNGYSFAEASENYRHQIGRYILLGLDFYIISDILHSMFAGDSMSLARLGVVSLLRTLIGYFLGKEINSNK